MTSINTTSGLASDNLQTVGEEKSTPSVTILLCTMNGEAYLSEQLESFTRQSHTNWTVWVSDDGSKDRTHSILEAYQSGLQPGRVTITSGPRKGFAANFLSLACKSNVSADYYAYADQDDIWQPNKISRALQWLSTISPETPALYCGRTELVDARGQHLGYSKAWTRPAGFRNALTQNIGGGNTMVFNHAGRKLLLDAGQDLDVVAHDWWTYLAITGAGGEVFFDAEPTLKYRQHQNNLIGANHDLTAPLRSIGRLIEGRFKKWNTNNIAALQRIENSLTPVNKVTLRQFSEARNKNLTGRVVGVLKSGVYRQTVIGNIGLLLATIFKKI